MVSNPIIMDKMKNMISTESRVRLWKMAGKIIKDHPLIGIGNDNYLNYYEIYIKLYPELMYKEHTRIKAHNTFLKVQSELGISGTIAFLGFILSTIYRMYSYTKLKGNTVYIMLFKGFFISTIAFMFMNILDSFFFDFAKVSTYFWILLAVCESIVYNDILEE